MEFFIVKASTLNKFDYPESLFNYEINESPILEAKEVDYKILFSEDPPKKRYVIRIDGPSFTDLYQSMYKFGHDIAISNTHDPGFPMYPTLIILDEPLKTK